MDFTQVQGFKNLIAALLISVLVPSVYAYPHSNKYPAGPDPVMTPGKLCDHGIKRYEEGITYCERDVHSELKRQIIAEYDRKLGYQIRSMNRQEFKIDHFIPLSIGGSNDPENLWPQHKSVYEHSDKLESHVANLIKASRIKQAEAIRVIKECKLNLDRCADLEDYLESLY